MDFTKIFHMFIIIYLKINVTMEVKDPAMRS